MSMDDMNAASQAELWHISAAILKMLTARGIQ